MYLLDFILDPNHTVLTMQVVFAFCVCFVALIRFPKVTKDNSINTSSSIATDILFRVSSLAISFIPAFWSLYLWYLYDSSGYQYQMICHLSRLHLSFGLDAMGLSLIVLTCALFPLCIVLMRTYTGIMTLLLLEIVILGSLTVLDILGFYILFEASLILLFLLIARTPYGSIDAASIYYGWFACTTARYISYV
jgi:NADH:ubiquinone oxidoreductase subunit 4 (subunit M)